MTACFSLVAAPTVPELPPLQTPGAMAEAEPEAVEASDPAEAGMSEAEAEAEAEAVVQPEPEPEREPEPVPAAVASPTAEASPFDAAPAPAAMDFERPSNDRYVEVRAPRYRGTGLFATAGALFGISLGLQAFDQVTCDGECLTGVAERVLLVGTMAAASSGGAMRGRADAYDEAAIRVRPKNVRGQIIAGSVLVGVGAVVGITNDAFFWRCGGSEGAGCAPGRTRLVMDAGVLAVSAGGAMLAHGLRYRRDSSFYERTRSLSFAPVVGRSMTGVSMGGRF